MRPLHETDDDPTAYRVVCAGRALEQALEEELRGFGFTVRQFQVLFHLVREGPLCQADIAARIDVAPPTVAGVVERMERDGWVARSPDPNDRRRKLVAPTAAVEPLWEQACECAARVHERATQGLDADALADLHTTLAAIQENLAGPEEDTSCDVL